jgi:hypothetical protein
MSVMEQIVETQGARIRELERELRLRRVDVNARLAALTAKYGHVTVDFFGDQWRLWFKEWNQHHGVGMHGSFAIHGRTIEDAIQRAEDSIAKNPPIRGFHCEKGCPHYSDDLY